MRGSGTRGWTRFEYQTSVPGNVGDAADPIWNTNYFSMGSHITFCRNWCTDSWTERSGAARPFGG
jgi:hypothetical protein